MADRAKHCVDIYWEVVGGLSIGRLSTNPRVTTFHVVHTVVTDLPELAEHETAVQPPVIVCFRSVMVNVYFYLTAKL